MKNAMIYLLFSMLFGLSPLSATEQKCIIHDNVLHAIAAIEGHSKREKGYPYIISFNKQSDMKELTQDERWFAIDKRTIDCVNLENCISVYEELVNLNIINVDLGAFQINPKFHKYGADNYFVFDKSKQRACEILMKIKKDWGWSWESLARYHSGNKRHNQAYQKRLKEYLASQESKGNTSKAKNPPLITHKLHLAVNEEH